MVSVMNVLGQITSSLKDFTPALAKGEGVATIDVSALPAGVYFVQLKSESGSPNGRNRTSAVSVAKMFVKE